LLHQTLIDPRVHKGKAGQIAVYRKARRVQLVLLP
jgi:hypothetical protein